MNTRENMYYQLVNIMQKLELSPAIGKYASNDATNFQDIIQDKYKDRVLELEKQKGQSSSERFSMKIGYGINIGGNFNRNEIAKTAEEIEKRGFAECHTFAQLAVHKILTAMENGTIKPPFQIKILSHQAGRYSHTFAVAGHDSEKVDDLKTFDNAWIIDPWACAMGYDERAGIFNLTSYPFTPMLKKLVCVYDSNSDPVHQERLGNKELAQKLLHEKEAKSAPNLKKTVKSESVQIDDVESFIQSLGELVKIEADVSEQKTKNTRDKFKNKYQLLKSFSNEYTNKQDKPSVILSNSILAYLCDPKTIQKEGEKFTWDKTKGVPSMGSELLNNVIKLIKSHPKVASILQLDVDSITPVSIIAFCRKISGKEVASVNKPTGSIAQTSILAQPKVPVTTDPNEKLLTQQFKEIKKHVESYKDSFASFEDEIKAIGDFLKSPQLSKIEKEFYTTYKDSFLSDNLSASQEDNEKVINALCKKMNDTTYGYKAKVKKILSLFQEHLLEYKKHDERKMAAYQNIKEIMGKEPISKTNIKNYCTLYINLPSGEEFDHKAEFEKLLKEYHSSQSHQRKPKH